MPKGLRSSWASPGGQLPQRGQAIGAAHLGFGFLQVAIGFGQLFRGGLRFPRLVAIGLGELVGQESDHGQEEHAQDQLSRVVNFLVRPQKEKKRQIHGASRQRRYGGSEQAEAGGGRNHRQEQNQVKAARYPAAVADQRITQRQFQHHGWNRAQAWFQDLNDAQRPQRGQRNRMALRAEDRQRGEEQQPDEILRSDVAAPGGCHLSVPILTRVTIVL